MPRGHVCLHLWLGNGTLLNNIDCISKMTLMDIFFRPESEQQMIEKDDFFSSFVDNLIVITATLLSIASPPLSLYVSALRLYR